MNRTIIFPFFLLMILNVNAQDFKLEYRCFLLQKFIKDNHIKTIKINNAVSLERVKTKTKYHCFFDELGRLIKVMDYYYANDSIPERAICYSYNNNSKYFSKKRYEYINSNGRVLYKKYWEIDWDGVNKVVEILKTDKGDVYRKNSLTFDEKGRLIKRHTESSGIIYTLKFNYDSNENLEKVSLTMFNPTLKKGPTNGAINTSISYKDNSIETQQWNQSGSKQFNNYTYKINANSIIEKKGWSIHSEKKSNFQNRTEFLYVSGFLKMTKSNDIQIFDYTFYQSNSSQNKSINSKLFTSVFYIDFFNYE